MRGFLSRSRVAHRFAGAFSLSLLRATPSSRDVAHSPPLVKGGQGREPHALVTTAYVVTLLLALAGLLVLVEVAR